MLWTEIADRTWVCAREGAGTTALVVGTSGTCVVDPPVDAGALRDLTAKVEAVTGAVLPARTAWTGPVGPTEVETARAALGRAPTHLHDTAPAAGPGGEVQDLVAFSSVAVVDLGDRTVELVHLGRGPSGGGAVAVVTGADVVLAGDLVAPRGSSPALGPACHPLEWPLTLDLLLGMVGASTVVVPGRGSPVDREAVEEQRSALGVVAETIRDLADRGVPPDRALADPTAAGTWPYPVADLGHAVRRGLEQLPHSQRRLPLV